MIRPGFRARSVSDVVARIGETKFKAGSEGWISVIDAGVSQLPCPACQISSPAEDGSIQSRPLDNGSVPIQRPIGMPFQGTGLLQSISYPSMTIARVQDATCIPGGIVIRGGDVFENSFSAVWDTRQHRHMRLSEQGWHLNPDHVFADADTTYLDAAALYLDDQHIDWFGHVLGDLLSPGWAYEYCLSFLSVEDLHVVVSAAKFSYVQDLLCLLGIPRQRILFIERPVRCKSLLLATKAFQIQHYVSPPAERMWHGMRTRFDQIETGMEFVYISRRANPTRRLAEEEDMEMMLSALGFHIVYPETLHVYAQIGVFSQAKVIVGCSGSNMFNLAFAHAALAVIVLVSPLLIHYSEQMLLSHNRSASFDILIGYVDPLDTIETPGSVHARWHLCPQIVREAVVSRLRHVGSRRTILARAVISKSDR